MGLGIMVCFHASSLQKLIGLTEMGVANQAYKLFYNGTSQETIETTDILGIDCKRSMIHLQDII